MAKQKKHIRKSSKGKLFRAGNGKPKIKSKPAHTVSSAVRKEIIKEHHAIIAKQLKQTKRARIPDIGILRLRLKPASKGGKTITAFGKTFKSKAKPRRSIIKFSAAKALKNTMR